ncbi:hypothetical protein ACLOJK_024136 [Asimina triloba]
MAFKMDKDQPLLQLAYRRAMGFLLDEMKMDLLLDLMGPDLDSKLSAGENVDADRCHLECLLGLSCSIWVPAGIRIVATDGLLSWHGWVQSLARFGH